MTHLLALAISLAATVAGGGARNNNLAATVSAGNTAFAVDLYNEVARDNTDNIFFSPASISSAIAMAFVGAGGETAEEIRAAMHYPAYDNELHGGYLALRKRFESNPEKYPLSIANALWGERTMPVEQRFLKHTERFYAAGLHTVDFLNEPDAARRAINDWTAENTRQKITDLLPEGSVTTETRLILTNAIYFKAAWESPFDTSATTGMPFHAAGGDVTVPMMRQSGGFRFRAFDGFSALAMPYEGGAMEMVVLLPDDAGGIDALEESLSADSLTSWLGALSASRAHGDVAVPRFRVTRTMQLRGVLGALGMASAFGPQADFRGITTAAQLFISDVVHKTFVDVDEAGTEAAAATALMMKATSLVPSRFRFIADHPFVFLIRDRSTGYILFLGRVMNPAVRD